MKFLKKCLENAKKIEKFIYNPNGSNLEYNALNHADVIKLSAQMIMDNLMLRRIIAQRYPILLIDESQDTKKELVDAFFKVQENFADIFTLGFLGDQKQRIYTDGKDNMISIIPENWEKPVKKMNFRCAKRIIHLANTIGKDIDINAEQCPREDADDGLVRLFIVQQREGINKDKVEQSIMTIMGDKTKDDKWVGLDADIKILTLEHMMAARRLGFDAFFALFHKVKKYQMSFLQGTVSEIEFFTKVVLPIAESMKGNGRVALEILKEHSPLLSNQKKVKPYESYLKCRDKARELESMVRENKTIREIVKLIYDSQLIGLPNVVERANNLHSVDVKESDDEELIAWVNAMDLPIEIIRKYDDYVNHRTRFDTHQGVKGLEFDRVLVIIDDSEAKGFMFSYDKLFGVKGLTETDINNIAEGKDTSINRTQRLFYVTCTRAKKSLAVLMYTNNPAKVKEETIRKGWFEEDEIDIILQS